MLAAMASRSVGSFIVIEGVDGCGKSTLARGLVARLRASGRDVVHTREPGGTEWSEGLRRLLLDAEASFGVTPVAEVYALCSARAQHLARVIEPALKRGETVVCERWVGSTIAYQGFGRGLGWERVMALCEPAMAGTDGKPVMPGWMLLLDVPRELALARRVQRHRAADRIEAAGDEFAARVASGFEALPKLFPSRVVVVDGRAARTDVLDAACQAIGLDDWLGHDVEPGAGR